jgi:hypothetical protein
MPNNPDCQDSVVSNLRDVRYCEVLPITADGSKTETATVYNTLCLNLCPPERWDALTPEEAAREYKQEYPSTVGAKLNGPRHWVMDQLEGSEISTGGPEFTFGGIKMTKRGELQGNLVDAIIGERPWITHQVQRDTVYTYDQGKLVHELISPQGVFIMQSYSQQKDPSLTIDQLPFIERDGKIKPPKGWTYTTRMLTEPYVLTTTGLATVVQDDLLNTYQLRPADSD